MRTSILSATIVMLAAVAFSGVAVSWMKPAASLGIATANGIAAPNGITAAYDPAGIRLSISKSLPILQKSGYLFTERAQMRCASCHHNTMTSMIEEKSTQKGISFIDTFKRQRIEAMVGTIRFACNVNIFGHFIPAKFIAPYVLLGLNAEKYPADAYTDIAVDYLMGMQRPDGSFGAEYGRPPLEGGEMHLAAFTVRAIQLYAAAAQRERVKRMTDLTRQWMETTRAEIQQELVFQLLGLQYTGSSTQQKELVATQLLGLQRPDGGWSQLPTMASDAYATGQALYALSESGMAQSNGTISHPENLTARSRDEAFRRGIAWLLKNQDASGVWIVETRAFAIQPFFNSSFPPYDENQFISAAATSWASLALLDALPDAAANAAVQPQTLAQPNTSAPPVALLSSAAAGK